MDWSHLSSDQAQRAEEIYQALRRGDDARLRQLAELLATKPDDPLLGRTEFEVRDLVHQLGADAIQAAVNQRKKGVPRVQPELPPVRRRGSIRERSRQESGELAWERPGRSRLLLLQVLSPRPLSGRRRARTEQLGCDTGGHGSCEHGGCARSLRSGGRESADSDERIEAQ